MRGTQNDLMFSSINGSQSNAPESKQRLSFLGDLGAPTDISLVNLDQRNSIIAIIESGGEIKKRTCFSLNAPYEDELNSLRLSNRKKQAYARYLTSCTMDLQKSRCYVQDVNESRARHALSKEPAIGRSNYFASRRPTDPTIEPNGAPDYEPLYARLRSIKDCLAELAILSKEEHNVARHLASIQLSLTQDIVK